MQEILLISIGAFIAAALTVPAGFGLSTLLTPLVLFILPVHEAVAVVAIVHCAHNAGKFLSLRESCLLYTSPSPRDRQKSRMPSSA